MTMFKKLSLAAFGLFLMSPAAEAVIPGTSAAASTYNVTVTKVEVCRSAACTNPFVMGSGNQTFDIASVTAGQDVGQYVSTEGIPLWQTWSYVRVTISTTISIAGEGTDDGAQACRTVTGQASGSHVGVGTGTVGAGTGTLQSLIIPNDNVGTLTTADYTAVNMTRAANATTATITFPLSSPYTCKGVAPRIEVQFDTSAALGLLQTGVGTCAVFPRPPIVTITASDP